MSRAVPMSIASALAVAVTGCGWTARDAYLADRSVVIHRDRTPEPGRSMADASGLRP